MFVCARNPYVDSAFLSLCVGTGYSHEQPTSIVIHPNHTLVVYYYYGGLSQIVSGTV
jgi:hypothetical protein